MNRPILVIDDDPKACELMAAILRRADFEVVSAQDGLSGITLARKMQPAIILLDMVLPGIDGLSTCERLKQDPVLRDIPVVGLTASEDMRFTEKAFRAGAGFFLPKPFEASRLLHVVNLALAATKRDTGTHHRRLHPRFPAVVPVRCLANRGAQAPREVVGETGDVSLVGLLLSLPEALPPGTTLPVVELKLPQGSSTAKGTVVWQDSKQRENQGFRHGVRLHGFADDSGLIRYRRFLSEVATA